MWSEFDPTALFEYSPDPAASWPVSLSQHISATGRRTVIHLLPHHLMDRQRYYCNSAGLENSKDVKRISDASGNERTRVCHATISRLRLEQKAEHQQVYSSLLVGCHSRIPLATVVVYTMFRYKTLKRGRGISKRSATGSIVHLI